MSSINATVDGIKYSHLNECACLLCEFGNVPHDAHGFNKWWRASQHHLDDICLMCNNKNEGNHGGYDGLCLKSDIETYFSSSLYLNNYKEYCDDNKKY